MPTTETSIRSTLRKTLRSGALLLLTTGVLAGPAAAQSTPPPAAEGSWAVQPSGPDGPRGRDWFVYTLSPGETIRDVVAVSNLSDRPVRLLVYATDAVSIPDKGGLAALREQDKPTDVGSWVTLGASEHTVDPGMRVDIPLLVAVPDNASPGDHVGAIIAVDADDMDVAQPAGPDPAFNVRQRVGARMYVRVAGPVVPAVRVSQLSVTKRAPLVVGASRATVRWEVTNTGNVRLTPDIKVNITGAFGREIDEIAVKDEPELLPGGNLKGTTSFGGLPPFERLKATVLVSGEGVVERRSTVFWVVPWLSVAFACALIATAVLVVVRRRRRPPAPPAATQARDRESELVGT